MEIESLRHDFQTLIIKKPQNNSRAYQRRKEKKKKTRRTQAARPGHRYRRRVLAFCLVAQKIIRFGFLKFFFFSVYVGSHLFPSDLMVFWIF